MSTQDRGHRDGAIEALSRRSYTNAGDEYTRAGWAVLADPRPGVEPFEIDDRGWVGTGVQYLLIATLCYRVADDSRPARFRATEAASVSGDLANRAQNPAQAACFEELRADCHVAGGLSGGSAIYDDAADAYEEASQAVDDPAQLSSTPLFLAAAAPIKQVARSLANGEVAIDWEDLHGRDPTAAGQFLAARARYKKRRFPGLVERLVADGYLAAPRGTTEYATTHHRCPACDSTDVNWVGNRTLCLRCSRPTDPV
ncbi:hypothetical protein [Natrarchaeobaculum sulfurireducens]|uniref:Uncharacterized protein n=1 Tax=Natrarchaeobaculum sulfurireducens TaxID=2044521 RepID=A0A346PUU9_9EURY|nr:hypothetical protein [Natrarchaeobaculum sulfurireducens]AXR83294.1 hypothetical protein AArcMg_3310 [Natrarchaeobaculum sulfurireducens]